MPGNERNDSEQERKDAQRAYREPKIHPDITMESFKTEQDSSVTEKTREQRQLTLVTSAEVALEDFGVWSVGGIQGCA